jgi:hypothetical protein
VHRRLYGHIDYFFFSYGAFPSPQDVENDRSWYIGAFQKIGPVPRANKVVPPDDSPLQQPVWQPIYRCTVVPPAVASPDFGNPTVGGAPFNPAFGTPSSSSGSAGPVAAPPDPLFGTPGSPSPTGPFGGGPGAVH